MTKVSDRVGCTPTTRPDNQFIVDCVCTPGICAHPFNGPLLGTTQVSRYQKGKTNLELLKHVTASGSGISWATCKSAPRFRQITTSAPHYSEFFLQAVCPSCHPNNSVKALKATEENFTESISLFHWKYWMTCKSISIFSEIMKYFQWNLKTAMLLQSSTFSAIWTSLNISFHSSYKCIQKEQTSLS